MHIDVKIISELKKERYRTDDFAEHVLNPPNVGP